MPPSPVSRLSISICSLLPLLLVLTSIPSFISFCTIYCLYSFHPYNVTGFSMVVCLRHTEWLIYPSVVGAIAVGIVLLDQTCILALLCSKETTHSNPPLIYVHQLPQIKPKNFISFISSPFPAYKDWEFCYWIMSLVLWGLETMTAQTT